jgi:hypothetical protein
MPDSVVERVVLSSQLIGENHYRIYLDIEGESYIAWIVAENDFLFVQLAKNFTMVYELVHRGNPQPSVTIKDDDLEVLPLLTPQFFQTIIEEINAIPHSPEAP